jgi:hypothetical protein
MTLRNWSADIPVRNARLISAEADKNVRAPVTFQMRT